MMEKSINFLHTDTTKEIIEKELLGFLGKHLLAKNISYDVDTELSSVGIDSLSTVEILLFIERRYGVMIPDEKLDRQTLRSVSTIAVSVYDRLANKQ
jgi:acyl carrier protein